MFVFRHDLAEPARFPWSQQLSVGNFTEQHLVIGGCGLQIIQQKVRFCMVVIFPNNEQSRPDPPADQECARESEQK